VSTPPPVLVVMGVSGAGKSTVGREVAARLDWAFQEGDDLHPAANVAKMRSGRPLDDADREPWLAAIAAWIDRQAAAWAPAVIACSALKRRYRQVLTNGRPFARIVYVEGQRELIRARLEARKGHYFPPALLDSQFADLEPPGPDEHPIVVEAVWPIETQVGEIVAALAREN
jgi:carbohydrate kinase (thermoresistant glucokinase family)